jgi:hypothetical protein
MFGEFLANFIFPLIGLPVRSRTLTTVRWPGKRSGNVPGRGSGGPRTGLVGKFPGPGARKFPHWNGPGPGRGRPRLITSTWTGQTKNL